MQIGNEGFKKSQFIRQLKAVSKITGKKFSVITIVENTGDSGVVGWT